MPILKGEDMSPNEVRIAWDILQEFTKQVFVRVGVPPEDAATEAEVLVWANLRGVDSHGVQRVEGYVDALQKGFMKAKPNIQIIQQTPASLTIEADHALGPVVTKFAMRQVIEKARDMGIGFGLIRNTTHQGAMGYYALMAAKEGMAGLAIVCNPPNMAPHGARAAGVHNSPIAIAVPGKNRRPLILDMATSVAAAGKLSVAIDKGISIPPTWAIDEQGKPTTDPKLAKVLLPAGGPKGSGLALMFECLSSLMVGNPLLAPTLLRTGQVSRGTQNSAIAAINIGTFTDLEAYKENVDKTITGIKSLPTAEGFDEVLVPGEPEDRVHEERLRNGIPLPEGTIVKLRNVAAKLQIALPPGL